MEKTKKSTLEKYYISEVLDADKNVESFNFKKANQKVSGNFKEFVDAVQNFITVSEKTPNDTRVWFHRDGAYRGSVDITKARLIIEKVREKQVANKDAISYIESENLVDKPAPKPKVNLEEEAEKVELYVADHENKKASEVEASDVESDSKYTVVVDELRPENGELTVLYHLEHKKESSEVHSKTLYGFKQCTSCQVVEEAPVEEEKKEELPLYVQSTEQPIHYHNRRDEKWFVILLIVLSVLIVVNIVLIALRATGVF
ncbi:hypothetical protein [Mycoplasma struthionis]|uniref:Uncharacterized protein n=1 Tax=Mycoplasma struthionis TaxID=538220 RepID=A0A502M717_9MOLU|nr:hypothetical protein [Mycoplasma struthionis]TPI01155.1 hypothetical protein FJM01_02995 [Mycoplasma struthionis]